MNARLSVLLFLVFALSACQHVRSRPSSITAAKAEELTAKIQPGMTLGDARRIIPHIGEDYGTMTHGGLMYQLDLSPDYCISFRVSHRGRGSSEYERHLFMSDPQALLQYYSHNVINLSPCLFDRKSGKMISGNPKPW
jgi:hypothetical protein